MKISILHPSRSRPDQALDTITHWLSNASRQHEWEYILSLDSSDPELHEYMTWGVDGKWPMIIER